MANLSDERRALEGRLLRRPFRLLTLVAAGLIFSHSASAADAMAPAENWVLPLFTKEGPRSMTARGTQARIVSAHEIEVIDLNLVVFSGDVKMKVESILLSPDALFFPDQKTARGEKSVRFIGDNIEASGTRWVYRHAEKKISLDGEVRVTFAAELKNILQ